MVDANGNGNQENSKKKGFCGCLRSNLFPEKSFQSWGNYTKAVRETKTRLKDRILTRSLDHLELNQVRALSQNEMKKTLNWFNVFCFGIGAVLGAGIFVLTGEAAKNLAGPAVFISYAISGISALFSVLCYAEFSVELPVAGGSFSYLRVELGDFVAYIAAGNILFEYVVSGASVARAWTSYFATLCNHKPNEFRINVTFLDEGYNHLDPISVAVSIAICVLACWSMKGSSRVNSIATIVQMVVIIFILVFGFTKRNISNIHPFVPYGVRGVLKASAVLFFTYVGFDAVATLGEEVKNPRRDIPIGLIGSMIIIIITYCLLAATLSLMQPYYQIDTDAPFTIAFEAVGMKWAKFVVAFGALMGMTNVLLANIIGQARYFTHISRTHMAPPFLAVISKKTGTPVNATVLMTIANCIVAFFTSLEILANLLSISTLFIFSLVALALIVRRYYVTGETSDSDRNKLVCFLILIVVSSIGLGLLWAVGVSVWVGYGVMGMVWFLGTLGLKFMVKEVRKPKYWGVPLMPWLPSASIAINFFIMGSVDGDSFKRFMVWTFVLLGYYLLVGLHASYDAAKETSTEEVDAVAEQGMNVESRNSSQ